MILIFVDGLELASGTLREALNEVHNLGLNTDIMVKSFMFSGEYLALECEILWKLGSSTLASANN